MIDSEGYRANVGIIIANQTGQVLWARRIHPSQSWQFPQGGMEAGETQEQAMFRELMEEVGLAQSQVEILNTTKDWLYYDLPEQYVRKNQQPVCIGQKQKWFLLRLLDKDSVIKLNHADVPEFSEWRWVSYWYPLNQVIYFKKNVYRRAMLELAAGL